MYPEILNYTHSVISNLIKLQCIIVSANKKYNIINIIKFKFYYSIFLYILRDF